MTKPAAGVLVINDVLADLGFHSERTRTAARAVLESRGLTNAKKQRIAASKLPTIEETIRVALILTCTRPSCRSAAERSGRTTIDADRPTDCETCGGSANRTEIDHAVSVLLAHGMRHLVVVGGSPGTHQEIVALAADRIDVRLISGTERRNSRDAKADLAWADVVIVWGGTELHHKVSKLYTDGRHDHVVTCSRRGVSALAATIVEHVARR